MKNLRDNNIEITKDYVEQAKFNLAFNIMKENEENGNLNPLDTLTEIVGKTSFKKEDYDASSKSLNTKDWKTIKEFAIDNGEDYRYIKETAILLNMKNESINSVNLSRFKTPKLEYGSNKLDIKGLRVTEEEIKTILDKKVKQLDYEGITKDNIGLIRQGDEIVVFKKFEKGFMFFGNDIAEKYIGSFNLTEEYNNDKKLEEMEKQRKIKETLLNKK